MKRRILFVLGFVLFSVWVYRIDVDKRMKRLPIHRRQLLTAGGLNKRLLDIALSIAFLIVFAPLLVGIALIIRITSPGPIFYKATRIGRNGKPFKLYKFRSMIVDAHTMGPGITTAGDPRITPIGRILRDTKLDELPQLLNVLKGEMSLVGPRPEDPRYVKLYTSEQRRVLHVRPGITSPASIHYRHEEAQLTGPNWETQYINEVLPAKLALDLDYAGKASLSHDLAILWRTARALLN